MAQLPRQIGEPWQVSMAVFFSTAIDGNMDHVYIYIICVLDMIRVL